MDVEPIVSGKVDFDRFALDSKIASKKFHQFLEFPL
jgi:hypothetical protein